MNDTPQHFKGREAIEHVAEAQAKGIISAAEIHGLEVPGQIASAADAARDTAIALLLIGTVFSHFAIPVGFTTSLVVVTIGWLIWKAGRASWLGWSRLERLHRVVEQERWEIEHNRPQEKAELRELYRAKGFEGKLLEDVIEVLMANGDRLLKVMVEEELGLTLQNVDHPLKQGIGAAIGTFFSGALIILAYSVDGFYLFVAAALAVMGTAAALLAHYSRNRLIPAIIWNMALGVLAFGFTYYFLNLFL